MSNKTRIINLFGGPGTGKSTTAAGIFHYLKGHDIKIEYVPEFAKDLTYNQDFKTLKNQVFVLATQYHRLWRLRDEVDLVVTDSPLIIGKVYSKNYHHMIDELFGEFENDNYFITRSKTYMKYGRTQTEEEAKSLDKDILNILNEHAYETVPYDSAAKIIADKYISKLK